MTNARLRYAAVPLATVFLAVACSSGTGQTGNTSAAPATASVAAPSATATRRRTWRSGPISRTSFSSGPGSGWTSWTTPRRRPSTQSCRRC